MCWTPGSIAACLTLAAAVHPQDPIARLRPQAHAQRGITIFIVDAGERPVDGADLLVIEESAITGTLLGRVQVVGPEFLVQDARTRSALAHHAKRFVSDGEGAVTLALESPCFLLALARGHAELRRVDPVRERELDLRVGPREGVDVIVRDASGKPVAGVPLWLAAPGVGATSWRGWTRSDSLGRARLTLTSLLDALAVQAGVVARDPVQRVLDPEERAGRRTVELALPPCGAVRVLARGEDGALLRGLGAATLGPIALRRIGGAAFFAGFADPTDTRAMPPLAQDDGVVLFAPVALGLPVRAEWEFPGETEPLVITGEGPRHDGELVVLGRDDVVPAPTVSIRVLAQDGSALTRATLHVVLACPGFERRETLRTDAEGRLSIALDREVRGRDDAMLAILRRGDGQLTEYRGEAHVPLRGATGPGAHALDDVALHDEVPIVQGVVLDESGQPVSGVDLIATHGFATSGGSGFRNLGDGAPADHRVRSGRDGSFVIKAFAPRATSPKLAVYGDGERILLRGEDPQPGAERHEVVVAKGARISGRTTHAIEPGRTLIVRARDREEREQSGYVEADGTFVITGLAPGRYALLVYDAEIWEQALATIEGLELVAGEACADPRLASIDWKEERRRARVTVVDGRGAAVEGVPICLVHPLRRRLHRELARSTAAAVELDLPADGAELEFAHPDWCTRFVSPVLPEQRVVLQPRPRARVRFVGLPPIAEGLCIELEVVGVADGRAVGEFVTMLTRSEPDAIELSPPCRGAMSLRLTARRLEPDGVFADSRSVLRFAIEVPPDGTKAEIVLELDRVARDALAEGLERLGRHR